MEPADVRVPGTLASYLRTHLLESHEDETYVESVADWFPAWCIEHPDEAAAFQALLGAAIVDHSVDTSSISASAISRVCGHITPDADAVDVDEVLRAFWFELWPHTPIPGDRHPLPPWWWKWGGTIYTSTASLWSQDDPDDLDERDRAYLERHTITWDDLMAGRALFRAIVPPGDRLPVYLGYLRMLRARWDAGDHTAVPTLPPDPTDLEEALNWVGWWPQD